MSLTQTTYTPHCSSVEQTPAIFCDREPIVAETVGSLHPSPSCDQQINPAVEPLRAPASDIRVKKFGLRVSRLAIKKMREYGSVFSREHANAIRALCYGMSVAKHAADGEAVRLAFDPDTGAGKTISVRALINVMLRSNDPDGIVVTTEKISQFKDLVDALKEDGFQINSERDYKIGVWHSGGDYNKIVKRCDFIDISKYQIIIVAHNALSTDWVGHIMDYRGVKRALTVWDESAYIAVGVTVSIQSLMRGLAGAIAWMETLGDKDDVGDKDALRNVHSKLTRLRNAIEPYAPTMLGSRSDEAGDTDPVSGRVISIPLFVPEKDEKGILEKVIEKGVIGEYRNDIKRAVQMMRTGNARVDPGYRSNMMLHFEIKIPDLIDHLVVLDASASINELQRLNKIDHCEGGSFRKDHSDVTIYYGIGKTGAEGMHDYQWKYASEFASIARQHMIPIVDKGHGFERIPKALVLHHKPVAGKDGHDIKAAIRRKLESCPDILLHDYYATWGDHTSRNEWRDCEYFMSTTLFWRPLNALEADLLAVERDLGHVASAEEKRRHQVNKVMIDLHQALGRTAIRKIIDGKAGKLTAWVLISSGIEKDLHHMVSKLMPGAKLVKWRPKYAVDARTEGTITQAVVHALEAVLGTDEAKQQGKFETSKLKALVEKALRDNPSKDGEMEIPSLTPRVWSYALNEFLGLGTHAWSRANKRNISIAR